MTRGWASVRQIVAPRRVDAFLIKLRNFAPALSSAINRFNGGQMQYRTKQVPLSKIYLDNDNPRHDPIDNEPEIVAHLIAHEKVKNLAADIAKRGTSPLERLAAIPHSVAKSSFIAVEGNRRVCALKLLADPDKAPEDHRSFFRNLASKMEAPPKTLEVVEFDDRESARQWIELRHDGEQDGVGTRSWRAAQKARFSQQGSASSNPNAQTILLLDYAAKRGLVTNDERDQLSVTTLTRFLSNPVFRNVLGLANAKDLSIIVPQEEFDRAVEKFLRDAIEGKESGVHSRTSKQDREDYSRKLQKQGLAPTNRLHQPIEPKPKAPAAKPLNAKNDQAVSSVRRNNKSPDARAKVVPSAFKAKITDTILKRLFDELRDLDSTYYSFACAYLLRAVVERAVKLFLKKRGKGHEGDLHVLIGRVADELQNDGVPVGELKYLRVMANDRDSKASPETLGSFVHGSQIPTGVELARAWDNLDKNLSRLFAEIQ